MRRFTSPLGVTLLAFVVGGWGSTLAVAFCPHAGMNQTSRAAAEDHSCCPAELETTSAAHRRGSHQEPAHAAAVGTEAVCMPHAVGGAAPGRRAGSCEHCVGRNESPAAPAGARELTLRKRVGGKIAARAAATAFVSHVTLYPTHSAPTRHAPPGPAARRHLLLRVFLI